MNPSYDQHHRQARTVVEFDRSKSAGVIALLLKNNRTFGPDDLTKLSLAYHAVLRHLGLADREDGATLMVAKEIVALASEGERDPGSINGRSPSSVHRTGLKPFGFGSSPSSGSCGCCCC
jgi:hypothetical protein